MTKGQTSKMEARKKKGKAATAQRRRRPLPAGWIQGDFLPSTVTEGDLLELVEHDQLVHKSWRLPADDEVEPAPREGERVLLLSHVHRGFQKKNRSIYPALQLSESVRNWQSTWFYCQDIACPNADGLPPFSLDRPAPPKQLALSKAEKKDIQPLVEALADVVRRGVTGMDLLEVFIGRRIQPLQARHHAMWHYAGPEDSTRTNVEGILEEKVTSKAWTNWFSPVSSGKLEEEDEEGSQEGSVESDEYIFDSEESEEENNEEEEKDEEPDSLPLRPEHQNRRRQESAVSLVPPVSPSAPPASPAAPSVRGGRADPTAEPVEEHVPEAAPPAAAPAADALPNEEPLPTEPALTGEEPTGVNPGMNQDLPPIPGSSNTEFNIRCVPAEQVGAVKETMVRAELMAGEAKKVYDSAAALYQRSLELRDNIRWV
ncbi:hypothetical protein ZWY2020_024328 [Hordeum vulgare]|nr:hypothetical protein ZWY2020_024328 [Hordeum vulgare]